MERYQMERGSARWGGEVPGGMGGGARWRGKVANGTGWVFKNHGKICHVNQVFPSRECSNVANVKK